MAQTRIEPKVRDPLLDDFAHAAEQPRVAALEQTLGRGAEYLVDAHPQELACGIIELDHVAEVVEGQHRIGQAAQNVFTVVAFIQHFAKQARIVERNGALRGEHFEAALVTHAEWSAASIQDLHHADRHTVLVQDRHAQHRARAIAGLAVDFRIEARIGIGIGNIDRAARGEYFTGDAEVCRNADLAFG